MNEQNPRVALPEIDRELETLTQEEVSRVEGGVTLSDCLISSYQTGGRTTGNQVPTDSLSLNFTKIEC